MKFLTLLISLLAALGILSTGCTPTLPWPLSETVLLSVNYPGDGFGTQAMCASAEACIHKDGTIHVWMPDAGFTERVEIAVITMSPEDYADLVAFADVDSIPRLRVREQRDVCDGNSTFITLYADGEPEYIPVVRKGGYMPRGKRFWERYSGIRQRLDAYGVQDAVAAWRDHLEAGEE